MSKLYMLCVTGGNVEPYLKLVTVEDPLQFVGLIRAKSLQDQIDKITDSPGPISDDAQANILRYHSLLKVRLYETGLDEYPDSEQEVSALYRKFKVKGRS